MGVAETLQHSYFTGNECPPTHDFCTDKPPNLIRFSHKNLLNQETLHEGNLWKLTGDPKDETAWELYRMWITNGGNLAYLSKNRGCRVVLFDADELCRFHVRKLILTSKLHCFELYTMPTYQDRGASSVFGCESHEDCMEWIRKLTSVVDLDLGRTVDLGTNIVKYLDVFRSKLMKRKVPSISRDLGYQCRIKSPLWRVKAGGDMRIARDWVLQEMWFTRNGHFVLWNDKDGTELLQYTRNDLAFATIELVPDAARPHAFRISIQSRDDFVLAPTEFAALSSENMHCWISEFRKLRCCSL